MPDELVAICADILQANKTESEWALCESDDMFQSENMGGGFDADEGAFCFSFYEGGQEYWFQLTLNEVLLVSRRSKRLLDIRLAAP